MRMTKEIFGRYSSQDVYKYTLKNSNGLSVTLTNFGAAVISILTPDRHGNFADVVCGYDNLQSYIEADGYQGATVGRVANRICHGKFNLDGIDYSLYLNDGQNHLHGGKIGYDKRIWRATLNDCADASEITFSLFSPSGDEGYPGNLSVNVTYRLDNDNALSIRYDAKADARTPVSLTNHTYFNLGGYGSGKIYTHELWLDADTYLPTDEGLIPTG